MNHADHVNLLQGGIPAHGGMWADLGSGTGAFTLALADLIGASGEIYSVDKGAGALQEQRRAMTARFPGVTVHYRHADFTQPLDLPPLDGIVMANSLHFVREKAGVMKLLREYLQPDGRLILVEYNADQGNTWVPYPLSYLTWAAFARQQGFRETRQLAARPSRFLGEIYSAVSLR